MEPHRDPIDGHRAWQSDMMSMTHLWSLPMAAAVWWWNLLIEILSPDEVTRGLRPCDEEQESMDAGN